jgi:dolichol-phosphate mannosyltransferase
MRPTVIIPTYNEIENLESLVDAILGLPCIVHMIVVDDHSPDGTGELADQLARQHQDVQVVHRSSKLGLGTAYAAGFKVALAHDADPVITMDADFSHHPEYIPVLLAKSKESDLVIGSRYIRGSGVKGWAPRRRLLSWGANTTARLLLGLQAHDCTAGFRCYRRHVLSSIDYGAIRAKGYSYLIEMLYYCQLAGFRVSEVPIILTNRRNGQSKISSDEIRQAMGTVVHLAVRRQQHLLGLRREQQPDTPTNTHSPR